MNGRALAVLLAAMVLQAVVVIVYLVPILPKVMASDPYPGYGDPLVEEWLDNWIARIDEQMQIRQWPPPYQPCPADIDNSGNVDVQDFLLLLGGWNEDCPPAP